MSIQLSQKYGTRRRRIITSLSHSLNGILLLSFVIASQSFSHVFSVLKYLHHEPIIRAIHSPALSMTTKDSAILGFDIQETLNAPNFSRFGRVHADNNVRIEYQSRVTKNSTDISRKSIQRIHARSPIKKANISVGSRLKQETRSKTIEGEHIRNRKNIVSIDEDSDRLKASSSPLWLPFIPTYTQIQELKWFELKSACQDRGLQTTGKKADLQARLTAWSQEEQVRRVFERNSAYETYLSSSLSDSSVTSKDSRVSHASSDLKKGSTQLPIDSIEPLVNRRKSLLLARDRSKTSKNPTTTLRSFIDSTEAILGKNSTRQRIKRAKSFPSIESEDLVPEHYSLTPTKEYLVSLSRSFYETKPETKDTKSITNNYQIQQLYLRAKHADQAGDLDTAQLLLQQLRVAAPYDLRVVRRLARLETQKGRFLNARSILLNALKQFPNQSHILQGLGALEVKLGNIDSARKYFKEAIRSLPTFPNPYHALATLEHSSGNIRSATSVIRLGLKNCPTNHRLHHAMGDLYREAMMLDLAENSYRKGLDYIASQEKVNGKDLSWAKSFFYLSLSYIAFEKGDIVECRRWLSKSFSCDVNELFSQGWIALASFEESQGQMEKARVIYRDAANTYESRRRTKIKRLASLQDTSIDTEALYPFAVSDRWTQLYSSWAKFEECNGSYDETNNVYSRAMISFPNDITLLLAWAKFQAKHRRYDRSRTLFEVACDKASCSSADPYRLYAEFEMHAGNYKRARSIFYLGAQSLSEARDGAMSNNLSLARLFLSWAVCEWHLLNHDRTEVLFDHALRLTDDSEEGMELQSFLLFSIARFLYHARKDFPLAQHCICLCLKDNRVLSHNVDVWYHWSKIARAMSNHSVSDACLKQVELLDDEGNKLNGLPRLSAQDMQQLRRAPWDKHTLILSKSDTGWYDGIRFPDQQ